MNRWYARRHRMALGLLALLALDAALYFGWVRRPATEPEFDPARLERLSQEVSGLAAEVARLDRVREQAPRFRPQLEKFAVERFPAERTGFSRVAGEPGATPAVTATAAQGARAGARPSLSAIPDSLLEVKGRKPDPRRRAAAQRNIFEYGRRAAVAPAPETAGE